MRATLLSITLLFGPLALAQTLSSSSATIQAMEMAALCPQGPITDVLLTGNATWTMGSDNQSGQLTLKGRASGQSRMDLALGTGPHSEIRINDPQNPQYDVLSGGQWTLGALHNSWIDANWFFPALSALVVGPKNGLFLGSVSTSSRLYSDFPAVNQKPAIANEIQMISTVLYEIDPSTKLPTSLHFFTHPDDNMLANIPVDVQFSDYRLVDGVQVPFHIQRYFNGTLQLDIAVSSATINPGLTDTDFIAN